MSTTRLGLAADAPRLTTGGGPLIGRKAAQILARRELDEVSFWQRILHDLVHLFTATGNAIPGGWFGLIVLGLLVAALIAAILTWVRPTLHRRARAHPVLGDKPRAAHDYRRSAARLADAGDYGGAIVDGVRALAAELDERGILAPRPGRTAHELAVEASAALPRLGDELQEATRLFDDVRYGDRQGTEDGYQLVTRVDASVRSAQVTVTASQTQVRADLSVPK